MCVGQSALLCKRCLVSLLESASVCHATENARNELRIILVAEAVKQLIFVVCIDVEPRVKRVAMLVQFGGIGVVGEKSRARRIRIQIQQRDGIRIQSPSG